MLLEAAHANVIERIIFFSKQRRPRVASLSMVQMVSNDASMA